MGACSRRVHTSGLIRLTHETRGRADDLQWAELAVFGQLDDDERKMIARELHITAGFADLRRHGRPDFIKDFAEHVHGGGIERALPFRARERHGDASSDARRRATVETSSAGAVGLGTSTPAWQASLVCW